MPQGSGAIAWAAACARDQYTNRPNLGQINLDTRYFEKWIDNKDIISSSISTAVHELTHLLGFSSRQIPYFIDPLTFDLKPVRESVVFGRNGQLRIKTNKVLEVARKHFGCPTISSIGFENGGGKGTKGSHWDRAELGDETMTGSAINDEKYSKFTLAFLEDTGYYYVSKYTYKKRADKITYGEGKGCGFINNLCNDTDFMYPEFCYPEDPDMK